MCLFVWVKFSKIIFVFKYIKLNFLYYKKINNINKSCVLKKIINIHNK